MELAEGMVAVVTGAASGIGRASALALARRGLDVVVADLDAEGAHRVAGEIGRIGRRAEPVTVDVAEREAVERLVDDSISWQGHCDLFFSNAGVGVSGPPHLVPLADWEWVIAINLWSHIWASRRILPHLLERDSGHLVHTSSSAGIVGFPTLAPYTVSKFGVVGLCESLATYLHGTGVGVSVVCPLGVRTNIHERTRLTLEPDAEPLPEDQLRERVRASLHDVGISAEQVADEVLDAVVHERLFVFPSPELEQILEAKWRDPDQWVAHWHAMADGRREDSTAGGD